MGINKITVYSFSLAAGIIATLALFLAIDFLASHRAPAKEQRPLLVIDLAIRPIPIKQKKKELPDQTKQDSLPQAIPQKKVTKKITSPVEKKQTSVTKKIAQEKQIKPVTIEADPVQKQQKKITAIKKIPIQSTRPALPIPVPLFQLTLAPHFLHREVPVYPEVMRAQGISGIVKLEALIDREGQVRQVRILKSAGEHFDEAAKRAIHASSFYPAKIKNEPVAVLLRLPVKFSLL